jgi:DNA-binding GntR family transcriptional regulator
MPQGFAEFPAVVTHSLPQRVAEVIREAILSGRLKPGDQIVESRLAKTLSVGQNAVREALQELQFQGFVVKVANKATYVTKLSGKDIADIYRLRIELEALAVEWARKAGRPTDEDRQALNALIEESAKAAKAKDLQAYAKADTEFHRYLWSMAENPYLQKALETSAVPLLSYVLIESGGNSGLDLNALASEHREWLREIEANPPKAAGSATRRLIGGFWKRIQEVRGESPEDVSS